MVYEPPLSTYGRVQF